MNDDNDTYTRQVATNIPPVEKATNGIDNVDDIIDIVKTNFWTNPIASVNKHIIDDELYGLNYMKRNLLHTVNQIGEKLCNSVIYDELYPLDDAKVSVLKEVPLNSIRNTFDALRGDLLFNKKFVIDPVILANKVRMQRCEALFNSVKLKFSIVLLLFVGILVINISISIYSISSNSKKAEDKTFAIDQIKQVKFVDKDILTYIYNKFWFKGLKSPVTVTNPLAVLFLPSTTYGMYTDRLDHKHSSINNTLDNAEKAYINKVLDGANGQDFAFFRYNSLVDGFTSINPVILITLVIIVLIAAVNSYRNTKVAFITPCTGIMGFLFLIKIVGM